MRTASGFDDKDAQTDEEIFKEAKEFLQTVIAAESGNRSRAIAELNFRADIDHGQWPQTLYAERELDGRLCVTINHTDTFVSRVENSMKQQRPRIKCHPVANADIDKAQLINGIVRHVENRSQASVAYDAAGSSALSIGWGYMRLVPEYVDEKSFDQELRILPIRNTFTVYRDPGSILPDGSDSRRYIVSEKIKRIEYKARYPNAENVSFDAGGVGEGELEWESQDEIRLAEYFRIVEKPERLFKMADGTTRFESDFAAGVLDKALKRPEEHGFAVEQGKAVERKSSKRQVQWFKLNGGKVVDKRDLPGRYIPIVAVEGNALDINGRVARFGMIKNMIEPARLVNYWETMKTERLALAPKAEWTAYEGVIEGHPEWHDANRKSYSVLVGKAVSGPSGETLPLPIKTQPAGIEAGMSEAMQSAYSALQAIAGMPHEPGQDAKGEVISGVALQERRELADVTHFQYYDNQTLGIAFMGRLILDWIPHVYSTQRMQRIIGEDGVPSMVAINQQTAEGIKNDLTVGEYEVVMDTGPGYDTKRQEGAEAMISLLGTPLGEPIAKVGADLVVRNMDFAGADDLADRLLPLNPEGMKQATEALPKQAQAIVGAMQQTITQLQTELQHVQLELKYKTSTELGWMHVEREKAHLQAEGKAKDDETKRFDTEVKSHTAIGVAEIKVGGELLNTHTEAAHNKEAAEIALKTAEKAESKPN